MNASIYLSHNLSTKKNILSQGFSFLLSFTHSLQIQNSHKCFLYCVENQAQSHRPLRRFRDRETGAHGALCLIALLLLFSVKGKERKGSCANKFSSIHRLHLVRQGLLLCVPQRHSASQLPHLHTYTHTHAFIYIQGEF